MVRIYPLILTLIGARWCGQLPDPYDCRGDCDDGEEVSARFGDSALNFSWSSKARTWARGMSNRRLNALSPKSPAQRASVQGQPCVDCGALTSKQYANHKTPLVKEHYETGRIDLTKMREVDSVNSQCATCSSRQGGELSRYSREKAKELGLE